MSEEILKALMELFALVVRQEGLFLEKEREYVAGFLELPDTGHQKRTDIAGECVFLYFCINQ